MYKKMERIREVEPAHRRGNKAMVHGELCPRHPLHEDSSSLGVCHYPGHDATVGVLACAQYYIEISAVESRPDENMTSSTKPEAHHRVSQRRSRKIKPRPTADKWFINMLTNRQTDTLIAIFTSLRCRGRDWECRNTTCRRWWYRCWAVQCRSRQVALAEHSLGLHSSPKRHLPTPRLNNTDFENCWNLTILALLLIPADYFLRLLPHNIVIRLSVCSMSKNAYTWSTKYFPSDRPPSETPGPKSGSARTATACRHHCTVFRLQRRTKNWCTNHKKVILLTITSSKCQCDAEQYHLFMTLWPSLLTLF